LSLLYFAAASYAETARRLGKSESASSFLLCGDPVFGPAARALTERAVEGLKATERPQLLEQIRQLIEPVNLAGLSDPTRRNWYPVNARDLLNGAGKLGVTRKEMEELLLRCGFDRS